MSYVLGQKQDCYICVSRRFFETPGFMWKLLSKKALLRDPDMYSDL